MTGFISELPSPPNVVGMASEVARVAAAATRARETSLRRVPVKQVTKRLQSVAGQVRADVLVATSPDWTVSGGAPRRRAVTDALRQSRLRMRQWVATHTEECGRPRVEVGDWSDASDTMITVAVGAGIVSGGVAAGFWGGVFGAVVGAGLGGWLKDMLGHSDKGISALRDHDFVRPHAWAHAVAAETQTLLQEIVEPLWRAGFWPIRVSLEGGETLQVVVETGPLSTEERAACDRLWLATDLAATMERGAEPTVEAYASSTGRLQELLGEIRAFRSGLEVPVRAPARFDVDALAARLAERKVHLAAAQAQLQRLEGAQTALEDATERADPLARREAFDTLSQAREALIGLGRLRWAAGAGVGLENLEETTKRFETTQALLVQRESRGRRGEWERAVGHGQPVPLTPAQQLMDEVCRAEPDPEATSALGQLLLIALHDELVDSFVPPDVAWLLQAHGALGTLLAAPGLDEEVAEAARDAFCALVAHLSERPDLFVPPAGVDEEDHVSAVAELLEAMVARLGSLAEVGPIATLRTEALRLQAWLLSIGRPWFLGRRGKSGEPLSQRFRTLLDRVAQLSGYSWAGGIEPGQEKRQGRSTMPSGPHTITLPD